MTEGVDITIAQLRPVDEFDTQLISRAGFAHKFIFVDAKQLIEQANVRDCSLAHTDCPDRVGFNKLDFEPRQRAERSEEHTSELQSLMRNSYAVFCLKKK